jgi:hypothetical protein
MDFLRLLRSLLFKTESSMMHPFFANADRPSGEVIGAPSQRNEAPYPAPGSVTHNIEILFMRYLSVGRILCDSRGPVNPHS